MSESQIVVCEIGSEYYGIDIDSVYEIIRYQDPTAVPSAPPFVEGVINLRGRIVPVVDLAGRFGRARGSMSRATRIVVTGSERTRVGLIVDGVSEVLSVPDDAIEATPGLAAGEDTGFLRGLVKLEDRLVILLRLDNLFGTDELRQSSDLAA
jgi:purine-binding chemotaxis protein CheW